MEIKDPKDMMIVILAGLRQEAIVSYLNAIDDPSYEDAYFSLMEYAEHIRESRRYGITLTEVKNMHHYLDALVKNKIVVGNNSELKISYSNLDNKKKFN